MARDVWEYFEQRRRECRKLSLSDGELLCLEEEGSAGKWGQVHGTVTLNDDAYINVREVVHVENGHAHREEYAYYLIIDGIEIWGHERDPTHDPAVHCHGRDHVRYDAEPIAFKAVVELAWETVSQAIEDGLKELDPMKP